MNKQLTLIVGSEPIAPEAAKVTTAPPVVDADTDTHDFDWIEDRDDVVVEQQPATAIYTNTSGAVVIRQDSYPDDDSFIFIRPENLDRVIARLKDFLPPR